MQRVSKHRLPVCTVCHTSGIKIGFTCCKCGLLPHFFFLPEGSGMQSFHICSLCSSFTYTRHNNATLNDFYGTSVFIGYIDILWDTFLSLVTHLLKNTCPDHITLYYCHDMEAQKNASADIRFNDIQNKTQ